MPPPWWPRGGRGTPAAVGHCPPRTPPITALVLAFVAILSTYDSNIDGATASTAPEKVTIRLEVVQNGEQSRLRSI